MATITEDYVSFETAKLLKEKGFDESTSMVYMSYGDLCRLNRYDSIRNSNYNDITKNYFEYTAPTLQMTMKWLREVHNLWCEISPEGKGLWYREVYSLTDEEYIPNSNGHKIKSYEEACETAIKYCLENLI